VTPEEREHAEGIFYKSVTISNDVGPKIVEQAEGSAALVTTTAAVLLSHFCIISNMSMYDAVDLLMSAYKSMLEAHKDKS
jgi:hypothetical protein